MGSFFVQSATIIGLEVHTINIEIDISSGIPAFIIVGLPDAAINESKERIRSALRNSGYSWPRQKIVVNLSPADIKKSGPHFDLAIAIGLILSGHPDKINLFENTLIFGELSLNGNILPIKGAYAFAEFAEKNDNTLIIGSKNIAEVSLQDNLKLKTLNHLTDIMSILEGNYINQNLDITSTRPKENTVFEYDFAHIRGQSQAKRALTIAAAGRHNLLLSGPPGTGKTLLAKSFLSILPELSGNEAREVMKICSIAGQKVNSIPNTRPLRSPHHSSSTVALVGGGNSPQPGEITLAHRGVLFLDEFAEFSKHTLNQLRQPVEDGLINISRASYNCSYPCKFILFAAMNPCPCGYANSRQKPCFCTPTQIQKYQQKISGPILDRIELHIELQSLTFEELSSTEHPQEKSSATFKAQVKNALAIQEERYKNTDFTNNSDLNEKSLRIFCQLTPSGLQLLEAAFKAQNLSGRAYSRLLKTARTIADLDSSANIEDNHLAEALSYRHKTINPI
jgi:magnesium chelatase family protein